MLDEPGSAGLLLVLFFFVVFLIVFEEVAVFRGFFFLIIIFFIEVVGDEVQMHRMRLGYLELGFALGTTQDFAFFDFVFVHVDFGGTFRAADHGSILRSNVRRAGLPTDCAAAFMAYYIPRCPKSTLMRGAAASIVNRARAEFLK
jgi:hypothetical protein